MKWIFPIVLLACQIVVSAELPESVVFVGKDKFDRLLREERQEIWPHYQSGIGAGCGRTRPSGRNALPEFYARARRSRRDSMRKHEWHGSLDLLLRSRWERRGR